ncbi:DUF3800 domain-containing protein [Candidatus Gottesmanbacteria bacterium]|nr:DUF3800 domain-containing protein [Candidatus Gottesmanbacteria bacterium]
MLPYKLLSLDESGKAAYTHPSKIFILSGVVIPEELKSRVDSKMRKVKKKYFDDEEVVFHGRDLARHGGNFTALKDPKTEISFWTEFVNIVNYPDISLYFVVTDKEKAKKAAWQPHTILRRSYLRILSEFARNIKKEGFGGKIVNESDAEQDALLIYAHNRLQVQGTGDGSVSAAEYKKMITCLSLVNKSNLDIDVQIADAVAFVGRLKYETDILKQKKALNQADKIKYRLINRKVGGIKNLGLFEVLI